MDFFKKLSDPVYFSRFGNRFNIVISILAILLWSFMTYMALHSDTPKKAIFWGLFLCFSVSNMIKSIRQLRRQNPKF